MYGNAHKITSHATSISMQSNDPCIPEIVLASGNILMITAVPIDHTIFYV